MNKKVWALLLVTALVSNVYAADSDGEFKDTNPHGPLSESVKVSTNTTENDANDSDDGRGAVQRGLGELEQGGFDPSARRNSRGLLHSERDGRGLVLPGEEGFKASLKNVLSFVWPSKLDKDTAAQYANARNVMKAAGQKLDAGQRMNARNADATLNGRWTTLAKRFFLVYGGYKFTTAITSAIRDLFADDEDDDEEDNN